MSGEAAVAGSQPRAGDLAHDAPRERIPDPRPLPGPVVNEPALANELDLGRTPVREAIARPATDRFSTDFLRRGADVTPVSLEGAFGIFEERKAIECDVAHLAARRATRHDLATPPRQAGTADRTRAGPTTRCSSAMTTRIPSLRRTCCATRCSSTARTACCRNL
jgi:hypothetical protein